MNRSAERGCVRSTSRSRCECSDGLRLVEDDTVALQFSGSVRNACIGGNSYLPITEMR